METVNTPETARQRRSFLPAEISFDKWENLEPFFRSLADRKIASAEELVKWLADLSELESVFSEELAWRYIRSTCDTTNPDYEKAYDFFVAEIEPKAAPWFHELNKKLDQNIFREKLDPGVFGIYLRTIHNEITIYREKNIPLFTTIDQLRQRYGKIVSDMTIEIDGNELTIQQASNFLKGTDRGKRKEAFEKIWERRLADRETLDKLFDELCSLRQQVAHNADFKNFRDYSFAALGRFDYTKEDCFRFHDAVAEEVMPVVNEIERRRKNKLQLSDLRPWDIDADASGKPALRPFANGNELLDKTLQSLRNVNPKFSENISLMRRMGHFDLDSRKGKAPGGYNYPLGETGVPFIFMNSAGSQRDVVTMVHEAGHAVHSFLMNDLNLYAFKNPPSEVCELASMSMELISMEHWDAFYSDREELRRARIEQLEKVISTLPWVAAVDSFQHWVYEHENHSAEERAQAWTKTFSRFESSEINWSGLEKVKSNFWQKQLHIFEVPFYYVEYGMAQLGAIAVWRNYRNNPGQALEHYEAALKLGYTKSIGAIYEAAGIRFDFSREYVRELVQFLKAELEKLYA